jgi:nucleoside-diphosphate-sugar epimerase
MKAIVVADQAAGTAGMRLVERPEPQAARLASLSGASPEVAGDAQTYAELEARVLAGGMEGIALRYGFYYGPGTWFHPLRGVRRQGPAAGIPNHRRQLRRLVVGPRRGGGPRDGRDHVAR